MSEERIIDLEMKLTHQDYVVEQLNQTIFQQQLKIDELEVKLNGLVNRLKEMMGGEGTEIRGHEKPPHY
jgi:Uncharacterized protein conserved in bacteria